MTHRIKLREEYEEAVISGDKNFEIRYNDRGYQKGDMIIFTVVRADGTDKLSPLEIIRFKITYVLHGWGLQENWCVFGIRKEEPV